MSGEDININESGSEISESEFQINNVIIEKNLVLQLINSENPVLYDKYYAVAVEETPSSSAAASENKKKILISKTLPIEDEYEIDPLYNIVFDNENYEYEYIKETPIPIPNEQSIASFYVITSQIDLDDLLDLKNYKVSGDSPIQLYKYVFPSLTIDDIDNIRNSKIEVEEIEGKESTKTPVSGGRRALSSCNSASKINAMLQLLYDIEEFKNYIDNYTPDEGEDKTIKDKNNLAANFKTIFKYINGDSIDNVSLKEIVCNAVTDIQTLFEIKNSYDSQNASIFFYKKMNEIFELKNKYGLNINNDIKLPFMFTELDLSKKPISTPNNTTKLVDDNQKYIVFGFESKYINTNINSVINVLSTDKKSNKNFYLVGYQYVNKSSSVAYKNIVSGQKFEDGTTHGRSTIGSLSKDEKSYFVALYSSTKPEVLPPPKSSFISNLNLFGKKGGSDSETFNKPPKEVQTKFRVSRRKSRKSKK